MISIVNDNDRRKEDVPSPTVIKNDINRILKFEPSDYGCRIRVVEK